MQDACALGRPAQAVESDFHEASDGGFGMEAGRGAEGVKTVHGEFLGRDIVTQLAAQRGVCQ